MPFVSSDYVCLCSYSLNFVAAAAAAGGKRQRQHAAPLSTHRHRIAYRATSRPITEG